MITMRYNGELHEVKLINFSLSLEEAASFLPAALRPLEIQGRALVSMVDVQLKNMRPKPLPLWMGFDYRHVAFRLLVEDSAFNPDGTRGIFFIRSMVESRMLAAAGNMFTRFRFFPARFTETEFALNAECDNHSIYYRFDPEATVDLYPAVQNAVAAVDRAYFAGRNGLTMLRILREKWPLKPVALTHFETDFFQTARPETAYLVTDPIPYIWEPEVPVYHLATGEQPETRLVRQPA